MSLGIGVVSVYLLYSPSYPFNYYIWQSRTMTGEKINKILKQDGQLGRVASVNEHQKKTKILFGGSKEMHAGNGSQHGSVGSL